MSFDEILHLTADSGVIYVFVFFSFKYTVPYVRVAARADAAACDRS